MSNILINWPKNLNAYVRGFSKVYLYHKNKGIGYFHQKWRYKCCWNKNTQDIYKTSSALQNHCVKISNNTRKKSLINWNQNIFVTTSNWMRSLVSFIARQTRKTKNRLISLWQKCMRIVKNNLCY